MKAKHRNAYVFVIASSLLLAGIARADDHNMKCNGELPATHAQLAKADQNTASHLELTRSTSAAATIDLDICSGDLTVVGGGENNLRLTVDLESPDPKFTIGRYLQQLDVDPQGATLKLDLPKQARARVLIVVPTRSRELHINLVKGNLSFDAGTVGGDRSINVVRGNVEIVGDAESYESLDLNVVAGRIHDAEGNSSGPLLANKSFSGRGSGTLSVNVVSGNVDVKPID